MNSTIELKGMKFFAHHGLYDEEREKGGWFSVNIQFHCDTTQAIANDSIDGTVNYEEIYNIAKEEMAKPSKLIEHVAGRIHQRIQKEVKGVLQLTTQIAKLDAPLGGPLEHVSITLSEK